MKLRRRDWEVVATTRAVALRIVEACHYAAGGPNTGVYFHALRHRASGALLGAAWWLPPTKAAALATYPDNWRGVLSLSRLAVAPAAPANAASFLLGGSVRLIDRRVWPCLVTYADQYRGHTGAIYRATNWEYVGLTKPQPVWVVGGRVTARKAGPKSRTVADMKALGAEFAGSFRKHKFRHVARRTVVDSCTQCVHNGSTT